MQQPRSLYPSTRIRGAAAFNQVWSEIFEDVEHFRYLQVDNLEVKLNGDRVLTTFDTPARGKVRGQPEFQSYKNYALLGQRTPDVWRIFHEHLSSGRK